MVAAVIAAATSLCSLSAAEAPPLREASATTLPRQRCDIEVYTTNDGLPSNLISCVEQDADGMLWFGTWNGLCCFDGYRFMSFDKKVCKGDFPLNNRMQYMLAGDDHRLWCVTYDRRLYLFNIPRCTFTDISTRVEQRVGDSFMVRNIYALPGNVVYVTCYDDNHHFFRLTVDRNGQLDVTDLYSTYCPEGATVYEVSLDDNGVESIYTSAPGNMARVWKNGHIVETIDADNLRQRKAEHTDSHGRHWTVRDDVSLGGTIIPYQSVGETFTPSTAKLALYVEQDDGDVWVAPNNGVFGYYDPELRSVVPYRLDDGVSENSSLSNLAKWYVDRQNNIWSISQHNLTRITPTRSKVDFTPLRRGEDTRAIMLDGPNAVSEGRFSSALPYSLMIDSVAGAGSRRWEGYKKEGLYMQGADGTLHHFSDTDGTLLGHEVFDIFKDSHGRVWVACYDSGLNLYDEATGKFLWLGNGLPEMPKGLYYKVRHIAETNSGTILLSTADGLVAFDGNFSRPADIQFVTYGLDRQPVNNLAGSNIMQALAASDGYVYISTMAGGLQRAPADQFPSADLKFANVEPKFRSTGIVQSFVEDNDGNLWLARENSLERYNIASGEITSFGRNDFGRDFSFTEAKPAYDPATDRVIMGVAGGQVSFRPSEMQKNTRAPKIVFTAVRYQGDDRRYPILYADEISVDTDHRNLTIYFAALDYHDNSRIRYAYMLEGIDSEWKYLDDGYSASFNNLPPGNLTLLVKSTNADGAWTDNVARLVIHSEPRFSETVWALLMWIAIGLAVVAIAVYIILSRYRQKREREQMEQRLGALMDQLQQSKSKAAGAFVTATPEPAYRLPEVKIEDSDKQLMEKFMGYVEKNIDNPNLKIQELSEAMAMSRSTLNERLKEITGMSPGDFIRYLRLKRACKLIAESDMTLSQIAYATGFSDPNYFSKAFRKHFNMSPTDYRRLHP